MGVGDGDGVTERGREGEIELQATMTKSKTIAKTRNMAREIIAELMGDYLRGRPR